jgi:DNA-binding CsgD family transcriptional regulator
MRLDAIRRLWERLRASGGSTAVLDSESFTESERAVGRMVLPLLEDLSSARLALAELESKARGLDIALRLLPVAAIVLDGDGNLLSANESARALFGGPAIPLGVIDVARLAIRQGTEHAAALAPHPDGESRRLRIVPAQVYAGGASADDPAVVFLVQGDGVSPAASPEALAKRFGLTAREGRVASLIARGMTNREIAEELGVSVETIRSHVARIFDKADVNSRSALVAKAYDVQLGGR